MGSHPFGSNLVFPTFRIPVIILHDTIIVPYVKNISNGPAHYEIGSVNKAFAGYMAYNFSKTSLQNQFFYGTVKTDGLFNPNIYDNCSVFGSSDSLDAELPCEYLGCWWNTYAKGIGNVSQHECGFEHYRFSDLIGWIKNGDTTGIVHPDSYFGVTPISYVSSPSEISIFPNPANQNLNLDLGIFSNQNLTIRLVNMSGRTIWERLGVFGNMLQIDLGGVLAGQYVLVVHSERQAPVAKRLSITK